MEELFKDSLGTIAVLIYILYPLFKRWLDRRKKKQEASSGSQPAAEPKTPKAPAKAPRPPKRSPLEEFLPRSLARAERLRLRASTLLERAERSPRLVRLVPALRDDLLERVRAIEVSLRGSPALSTVVQDAELLRGLEELMRYLETMAQQRMQSTPSEVGDADRMADACYAPILEFAGSQGLRLRTSTPVVITGDWPLSIVPRFASTRVAPIRVPRGFAQSVWLWPALAHEIAHDLYYSVDGLEDGLHTRLGLPTEVDSPRSEREIDGGFVRDLFGAWLSEVFADVMGTMTLGPAYVETMRRAFRQPTAPHETAAVFEAQGVIEEHPPARLRLYMATRVLHHLGRHEEADAQWSKWEAEHADVDLYFLPLSGRWVGLSSESVHAVADSIVEALLEETWPEFADHRLTNIPGFAYLHADHAEVQHAVSELARGAIPRTDVRWIMAAAVLAAAAQPNREDRIRETAQIAILGVGAEAEKPVSTTNDRLPGLIAGELVACLRRPSALRDAIILGEAFRPYDRPRWR
ncbi:MAG: hypothetical protein WBG86_22920 [Polyangiales bacterium]